MKRRIIAALALALGAAPLAARAGSLNAITVGTVAANTSVPAPTNGVGYRTMVLDNENATATNLVACTFDGTAGLNTAGSFTVKPGAPLILTAPNGWLNFTHLNCIATAASSPLTVLVE